MWYLILKSKLCNLHIRSDCILMNMIMRCTHEKKSQADNELLYNFCTELYSEDPSDKERSYRDLSGVPERSEDREQGASALPCVRHCAEESKTCYLIYPPNIPPR